MIMVYSKLKLLGNQDVDLDAGLGQEPFTEKFSTESLRVNFTEVAGFGKKLNLNLPKKADLIDKFRMIIRLPPLTVNTGTYAAYTNNIGHTMIDTIELEIGGKTIKKIHGEYLDIIEELNGEQENYMLGKYVNIDNVKANAIEDGEYSVEFDFFQKPFPIAAVPYEQVRLLITLRKFSECVIYDGLEPAEPKIECYMMIDYLYVNDLVAAKIRSNQEKSMMVTEIQRKNDFFSGTFKMDLDFNGPVKSIIFVLRQKESTDNNDHFNYSLRNTGSYVKVKSILKNLTFRVNGVDYISTTEEINHRINDRYMYEISFCENPRKDEYTGSLNFSRIDNAELSGEIEDVNTEIIVFAVNYNWIVTDSGHLYMKYIN